MTFAYRFSLLSLQLRRNKHTIYNCVIVNLLCVKYVALEIRINTSRASSKTGWFVTPQFYIHCSSMGYHLPQHSFIPVHRRKYGFVDLQLLSLSTARTHPPTHRFNGKARGPCDPKAYIRPRRRRG